MKFFFTLFVLLLTISASAQRSFEEAYQFIYSDKIASNVVEAHLMADSLLLVARSDLERVKAHMLLGTIEQSIGHIVPSLNHVFKALQIAELCGFVEWQSRANGFLATAFRQAGLYSESFKSINKCEQLNELNPRREGYLLVKISILQEKALYNMDKGQHSRAIAFIEKAQSLVSEDSTVDPRSIIIKATNDQLLGIAYLNLGLLKKADSLLNSSLTKLGSQESNLRPYIYRALAEKSMKENDFVQAKSYLDQAAPYLESANRMELKMLLYQSYINYYTEIDIKQVKSYTEGYNDLLKNKLIVEGEIADQLLSKNNKKIQNFERWVIGVKYLGFAALAFFFLLIVFFIWKFFSNLGRSKDRLLGIDNDDFIAGDTAKRLVLKLEDLVDEQFFLDPELSLSKLAIKMETNPRYVSFVIKRHTGKDFYEYIQGLRIAYIRERLCKEFELLECKISYIGSLCGYLSPSKFSRAFKAETGVLPSVYIQKLRLTK
ncbi:helix-turn-helix domain-containing protein [Sphingobacterium sp. UT-1RO-CII-1]|uniref:helix-turn-helix domain-containing protein n=1 Tax=Sphingobacterium sp. UT-1RO-CII-1 TaxID=2995225 RepID=UPI00227A32EB|nr:helix-turn-helix domain-containing protein [Sphingobacterium sp. UT-1RO-CII-1]MCY4779450.1 helix-turn-helix domain-containing protein [Sphingobacterium sp. UT-1RO-CII-1]